MEQYNLLQHPFYQLWLQGKLPQSALAEYSKQYYQLVDQLPKSINLMLQNTNDPKIQDQLKENIREEMGEGNGGIPHTELWLDFAQALGVSKDDVLNAKLLPETKAAIQTLKDECSTTIEKGAACLYGYESQVPEISKEKIHGLKEFYNITDPKALRFFEVHQTADLKHRSTWKKMMGNHDPTPTAKALWDMFDGMFDAFVPEEIKTLC